MLEGDTRAWPTRVRSRGRRTHVAVRMSRLVLQAADHALWNLPVQVHKVGVPTATSAAREWWGCGRSFSPRARCPTPRQAIWAHLQATPARLDGELPEGPGGSPGLHPPGAGHQQPRPRGHHLSDGRPRRDHNSPTARAGDPHGDVLVIATAIRTLTPSSSGYRQAMEHVTARLPARGPADAPAGAHRRGGDTHGNDGRPARRMVEHRRQGRPGRQHQASPHPRPAWTLARHGTTPVDVPLDMPRLPQRSARSLSFDPGRPLRPSGSGDPGEVVDISRRNPPAGSPPT